MNKQILVLITIAFSIPFVNAMEMRDFDFASFAHEFATLFHATYDDEDPGQNIEDQDNLLVISFREVVSKESIAQLKERMISWYDWSKEKLARNQDCAEEEMFYIFLPTWFMR